MKEKAPTDEKRSEFSGLVPLRYVQETETYLNEASFHWNSFHWIQGDKRSLCRSYRRYIERDLRTVVQVAITDESRGEDLMEKFNEFIQESSMARLRCIYKYRLVFLRMEEESTKERKEAWEWEKNRYRQFDLNYKAREAYWAALDEARENPSVKTTGDVKFDPLASFEFKERPPSYYGTSISWKKIKGRWGRVSSNQPKAGAPGSPMSRICARFVFEYHTVLQSEGLKGEELWDEVAKALRLFWNKIEPTEETCRTIYNREKKRREKEARVRMLKKIVGEWRFAKAMEKAARRVKPSNFSPLQNPL